MTLRRLRAAGLVALLALAPATALAFSTVDTMLWPSTGIFPAYSGDPLRPWSLRAYTGFMYDDNVLRSEGRHESDTISRLGIGGGYGARVYGRQAIVLEGYGEYRDYDRFDSLDHWAYGTRAEWLWQLGNQLAGTLGWRRTQRLADLGESLVPRRDILLEDRIDATGVYTFAPDWRITGGYGFLHVEHDGRPVSPTNTWVARTGIEYFSALGNAAGLEMRYGEGDAGIDDPLIGSFLSNRYEQLDVAATLAYNMTAGLRLRGRLGYTWREYTDLPASDFAGPTGRGAIEWRPGAKTFMVFELFRQIEPVIDAEALHADRRGALVGIHWAATAKLVFGARFTHERRIYERDPAVVALGAPLRDETLRLMSFTAGWEPVRFWQLSSALDFGERESNLLGRDYDYTAVTINLKYEFR